MLAIHLKSFEFPSKLLDEFFEKKKNVIEGWVFDVAVKMLKFHIGVPVLKFWLSFQSQVPFSGHPWRQQVTAQAAEPLPLV